MASENEDFIKALANTPWPNAIFPEEFAADSCNLLMDPALEFILEYIRRHSSQRKDVAWETSHGS